MKVWIFFVGLSFVCSINASSSYSYSSESCESRSISEELCDEPTEPEYVDLSDESEESVEICDENECGENEEYTDCGNDPCQNTCAEPGRLAYCSSLPGCYPGCICKPGYLRDTAGVCVNAENCYTCGENEQFTQCGANECQNTCDNPELASLCDTVPGCFPGCICQDGYLRNGEGKCVSPSECPTCQKPNEVWSPCGKHPCLATCEEPNRTYGCSWEGGCFPGCICAEGFLRNKDGDCVPSAPCESAFCTRDNEEYSSCGTACQLTCENKDKGFSCPAVCVPGCFCKSGLVRDANGVCIPPEDCVIECGVNEEYSKCVSPCPETCANLGDGPCYTLIACTAGCDCKPGFFRNAQGVCVPPEECVCDEGEEYNNCYNPCPPRTCDAIGKAFKCPADVCRPACQCARNYRRNSDGVCIPIEKCPPLDCSNPNEVYNPTPAVDFDDSCDSLNSKPSDVQSLNLLEWVPRCVCIDGYLRNKEGVCIPKEECVITETCEDPNAEVVSCPNPCPGGTCASPKFADCKAPCKISGCQCKEGYVKDDSGKCILLGECPPPPCECGENEEYNPCGTACPRTCENKDEDISCTEQCVPGCFCKEGLVRKNGVCVDPKDCGCGENELFSVKAPIVQETCETRGQKNKCKKGPGCICMKGYIRKCEKGPCIKIEDCECQ